MSEWKICLDEIETKTGERECKFLMYGTSRSGKTSLANTLINGVSSGGIPGPCPGTKAVHKMEQGNIMVYDTPGLLYTTVDDVKHAIARECHPKFMDCVIVCFDFCDA